MVSDLKTFTNKGWKITAQKKNGFWANFALLTWPLPERLAMVLWTPIQEKNCYQLLWGRRRQKKTTIGATIRIGREILCLPYAGFLTQ